MDRFNKIIDRNRGNNEMVVAAGIAEYDSNRDNSFRRVFERADYMMYQRKDELKSREYRV